VYNAKLRKTAVERFNDSVKRYEESAEKLSDSSQGLYDQREKAISLIESVTEHINALANTPKEFAVTLTTVAVEVKAFRAKKETVEQAQAEARLAAKGAGAGASVGALGVGLATLGPTAAMGIATTFGVASTGTAISALSGAAATNAALAWIGGGALATGGAGMAGGATLLALAGPVGWAIAGVAGIASVGVGVHTSRKNKNVADKADEQRQTVEKTIRKVNRAEAEVSSLTTMTKKQRLAINRLNGEVPASDYQSFTDEQKQQAAVLVNSVLSLAQLVNREVSIG
jgi:hypothetical protein